jgi:hypothetical protein
LPAALDDAAAIPATAISPVAVASDQRVNLDMLLLSGAVCATPSE